MITLSTLSLAHVHPSWLPLVKTALSQVDPSYLQQLAEDDLWLPGHKNIFNAFSLPLSRTRYILFGESPYPREQSANGYAFWDNAVKNLWSPQGMTKEVNRAVSLRHLIKMLLVAEGTLHSSDTSQPAIAAIDKKNYVQTIDSLFENFLDRGFLLLNASLVLSKHPVKKDATYWRPFIETLLNSLAESQPHIELILFGQIAKTIDLLPAAKKFQHFHAEHPYNHSFITHKKVVDFFRPLRLLTP